MRKSLGQQDYHKYCFGKGELFKTILLSAGATGVLAFFFYRSLWAVLPLSGVGVLCFCSLRRKKQQRLQEELVAQFRESILAVATSLQAGYSAENAFVDCYQDMALLYGEGSLICVELKLMKRGLCLNIPLEEQIGRASCRERV